MTPSVRPADSIIGELVQRRAPLENLQEAKTMHAVSLIENVEGTSLQYCGAANPLQQVLGCNTASLTYTEISV